MSSSCGGGSAEQVKVQHNLRRGERGSLELRGEVVSYITRYYINIINFLGVWVSPDSSKLHVRLSGGV